MLRDAPRLRARGVRSRHSLVGRCGRKSPPARPAAELDQLGCAVLKCDFLNVKTARISELPMPLTKQYSLSVSAIFVSGNERNAESIGAILCVCVWCEIKEEIHQDKRQVLLAT